MTQQLQPQGAGRRAFTAVELAVAIGIIMIITAMILPAALGMMRKQAVRKNAALIGSICAQAQQLALVNQQPADGRFYGVLLCDDPADATMGGSAFAAIVYATAGNLTSSSSIAKDPSGSPIAIMRLMPSAQVFVGNASLASGSRRLAWGYSYRTGSPLLESGSTFANGPASVGLAPIAFANTWNIVGYTVDAPTVAPGTATDPGLSVQTADGTIASGITIYPSGLFMTTNMRGLR